MPKYFFNVYNGEHDEYVDDVGEDLPNRAAAWETAARYAADSLRDLDGKLRFDADWRLEILGQDRQQIYQISVHAIDFAADPAQVEQIPFHRQSPPKADIAIGLFSRIITGVQ